MNEKIKQIIEEEERCTHMKDGKNKCGGKLKHPGNFRNKFVCQKCGEVYFYLVPYRYVI